jgi:O-antigen/teichoic acid export membrane protein
VVTALQFAQGLGFAAISLALLKLHPQGATSAVIGYTLATLLAAAVSIGWLSRLVRSEQDIPTTDRQRDFWMRLLPFAVWMWVTNLVSNVFDLVDRYMIIHHSGMTPDEALRQVGNYHSSRIIPLLFVGVAALFASMITPHLTTDWEVGRRESVVRRLNLALKLLAITLLVASTAVLFVAPPLFEVALRNKFQGGLHVLPCTLAYCAWFGLFAVAQNYLWCAERAALSNLPLLVGLILNILLNLVWLPAYGLPGAVWATTVSNLAAMLLTYEFSRRHGMQIDAGTWIASLAIGGLCFGAWPALAACGVVAVLALATDRLLHGDEKQQLRDSLNAGLERVGVLARRILPTGLPH